MDREQDDRYGGVARKEGSREKGKGLMCTDNRVVIVGGRWI